MQLDLPGDEPTTGLMPDLVLHAEVPRLARAVSWIVALCCALGAAACLLVPLLMPGSFDAAYAAFPAFVAFGLCCQAVLVRARTLDDRFAASPDGLACLDRRGTKKLLLPWPDIAYVRDHSFRGYVEIGDAERRRVIRLDYRLDAFAELMGQIGQRLARLDDARYACEPAESHDSADFTAPADATGGAPAAAGAMSATAPPGILAICAPLGFAAAAVAVSLVISGGVLLLAWALAGSGVAHAARLLYLRHRMRVFA